MDHPPSTDSSPRVARRALKKGAAALSAIAAPVLLVAVTAGPATAFGTQPTFAQRTVHTQDASTPVRFVNAAGAFGKGFGTTLANGELTGIQGLASASTTIPAPVEAAVAPTTTTTTAPRATVARPATPPAPAAPTPPPSASGFAYGDPADPATWDRLANCEAHGNWATNTGNGYYGGLQFSASTWRSVGGTGLPHQNSREVQIEMGRRLQARAGWGQWPACTRKLHYR